MYIKTVGSHLYHCLYYYLKQLGIGCSHLLTVCTEFFHTLKNVVFFLTLRFILFYLQLNFCRVLYIGNMCMVKNIQSYSCKKLKISQLSFLKPPPSFPRGSYYYQLVTSFSENVFCINKHRHI